VTDDIPDSCDCIWSITLHEDGSQSGAIFIASRNCQHRLMHSRTYTRTKEEVEARQHRKEAMEALYD